MLAVILLALLPLSANCATLDANGSNEVEHLLGYLKNSNCQFNRNGSWYPADQATEHLRKKYQYFLDKGQLDSAESFITKSASTSSMSGKVYLVLCPGHTEEESGKWLNGELVRYRKERVAKK
jgi:hypothetical protein